MNFKGREIKRKFSVEGFQEEQINANNFHQHMRTFLMVPPKKRTESDLRILLLCTSYLKFFANLRSFDPEDKLKSQYNGCRLLKYTSHKKGYVIFKHRDPPKNFYITISGTIGVFIRRTRSQMDDETSIIQGMVNYSNTKGECLNLSSIEFYAKISKLGKFIYHKGICKFDRVSKDELVYNNEYLKEVLGGLDNSSIHPDSGLFQRNTGILKFTLVNTIESGSMFGELGLIYKRSRAGTCIALTPIEIGYMGAEDFETAFSEIQRIQVEQKTSIIERYLIHEEQNKFLAKKLGIMFKVSSYPRGTKLVLMGKPAKNLYLITSGNVVFSVIERARRDNILSLPMIVEKDEFRSHEFLVLKGGQVVGEDFIFERDTLSNYQAVAESDITVYEIELEKLFKVCQENESIKSEFKAMSTEKIELIRQRIKEISLLPLFTIQDIAIPRVNGELLRSHTKKQSYDYSSLKKHPLPKRVELFSDYLKTKEGSLLSFTGRPLQLSFSHSSSSLLSRPILSSPSANSTRQSIEKLKKKSANFDFVESLSEKKNYLFLRKMAVLKKKSEGKGMPRKAYFYKAAQKHREIAVRGITINKGS